LRCPILQLDATFDAKRILEMDTNPVESQICPIALTKKKGAFREQQDRRQFRPASGA
jgi:hypothetical protein